MLPVESPQGKNIERKDGLVTGQLEEAFALLNLAGRCRTSFLEQVQHIGHCTKLFILSLSFHPLGKGPVVPILKIRISWFYSINRLNTPKLETTELGFKQEAGQTAC